MTNGRAKIRRRTGITILLASCLAGAPGCGFLANLSGACDSIQCQRRSPYYRGVYMDVQFWKGLDDPELWPLQKALGYTVTAIDFPITALFDTLAVPFIAIAPDDSPPTTRPAPILQQ